MATPPLKLIYLDHHYWRAECSRIALYMAGVPFEDARMSYDDMYASGALTFGTFPSLVVGGKGTINQTQAIAQEQSPQRHANPQSHSQVRPQGGKLLHTLVLTAEAVTHPDSSVFEN